MVSGSWVQRGSVPLTTARGLTGVVNGTTVSLYATSGGTGTPVATMPGPYVVDMHKPTGFIGKDGVERAGGAR